MPRINRVTRMTLRTRTARRLAALVAAGLSLTAGQALAQEAFPATSGKDVYEAICQGCHMPDGSGSAGAGSAMIGYPALAKNPKLAAGAYSAVIVTRGVRAMPQFGTQLNDTQIANVVNYIRTSFGNNYTTPLTPAQVTPLRPKKVDTGVVKAPG